MRRITVFFLFLIVIGMSCNKVSPVTLTAAQQLEYDINLIDEYLAENHIDAIKLENGVRYVITKQGEGPPPSKENCIRILYTGIGLQKTEPFDSNTTTGLKMPFKSAIPGMQIGLKQIGVGGKITIYIPSGLGYGAAGSYSSVEQRYVIDKNENIKFDVELAQLYQYNVAANYCYE